MEHMNVLESLRHISAAARRCVTELSAVQLGLSNVTTQRQSEPCFKQAFPWTPPPPIVIEVPLASWNQMVGKHGQLLLKPPGQKPDAAVLPTPPAEVALEPKQSKTSAEQPLQPTGQSRAPAVLPTGPDVFTPDPSQSTAAPDQHLLEPAQHQDSTKKPTMGHRAGIPPRPQRSCPVSPSAWLGDVTQRSKPWKAPPPPPPPRQGEAWWC